MNISWQPHVSLKTITERCEGTMVDHLGIVFTALNSESLEATMPVDHRTKQPIGIMHGGASCVLAETVGSCAANACVNQSKEYCVGLDINTNHIRSAKSGLVKATAKPFHLGRSTQVWGIDIHDEAGKLVSVTRLTMAVLQKA